MRRVFSGVNLQSDDFELFGLARRFAQDRAALDARWKDLQRQAHPDKFTAQGAAAQRIAMQWSVRINEAYQRLKNPLKRAAYLCELHGAPINAENNTAMPASFLMQQMQWREELDEAQGAQDLEQISQQCRQAERDVLLKIEHLAGPVARLQRRRGAGQGADVHRALCRRCQRPVGQNRNLKLRSLRLEPCRELSLRT